MESLAGSMRPASGAERIQVVDIVRGLALFGVLQINLIFFSGHIYRDWANQPIPPGWGGATLVWLRSTLLGGKAVSLLSMLFGLGLCIQLERARATMGAFWPFVVRRLGFLGLLGAVHGIFVWHGDILLTYALAGLMVVPMIHWSTRRLAIAGGGIFIFLPLLLKLLPVPEHLRFSYWMKQAAWLLQTADGAYGHGSWVEALKWRYWEWGHWVRAVDLSMLTLCLPLFLLGVAFWRSGWLFRLPERLGSVRRVFHATFWPGLLINSVPDSWAGIAYVWATRHRVELPLLIILSLGVVSLAFGYLMGVLVLAQRPTGKRFLAPFAAMGRMALTNYLAQSLLATWIFNGYGLGWWGRVSPSTCVLGGSLIFLAQAALSHWWLARFRFGPMEWLWRCASYARWQPMRLEQPTKRLAEPTLAGEG